VASAALNARALRRAGLISEEQQEAMVEAAAESNAGSSCAEAIDAQGAARRNSRA
jgi:hypothetical protein